MLTFQCFIFWPSKEFLSGWIPYEPYDTCMNHMMRTVSLRRHKGMARDFVSVQFTNFGFTLLKIKNYFLGIKWSSTSFEIVSIILWEHVTILATLSCDMVNSLESRVSILHVDFELWAIKWPISKIFRKLGQSRACQLNGSKVEINQSYGSIWIIQR